MGLLHRLNEFPPKRCRIVARIGRRPASHEQLANITGFSKAKIINLCRLDKWDSLTLEDADKFATACGLRLHRLRSDFYLKFRRMRSLFKKLDVNQRKLYKRLMATG